MARDIQATPDGDFLVDPATHDLAIIDGADEIAQRVRATLLIRYGEMVNLDPLQGSDYSSFLGKDFHENLASADMTSAKCKFGHFYLSIETNVPEVTAVHDISFQRLPNRQLHVTFSVEADIDGNTEEVEGGTDIGD